MKIASKFKSSASAHVVQYAKMCTSTVCLQVACLEGLSRRWVACHVLAWSRAGITTPEAERGLFCSVPLVEISGRGGWRARRDRITNSKRINST